MKKWMLKFSLLTLLLLLMVPGNVYAQTDGNVYDDANYFNESETASINQSIDILRRESGWNVYAVVTDEYLATSSAAYADDFFDTHSPEQEDGVVVLLNLYDRELYISTCGDAILYLSDERLDSVLDVAYDSATTGDYAASVKSMVDGVESYYRKGMVENLVIYDEDTGRVKVNHIINEMEIMIAVLAALATAGIIFAIVVGRYRMNIATYKYEFRQFGQVNLRVKEDQFINEVVTHRVIPKNTGSSSGGGGHSSSRSTTHRSSSGRSHGGRGRSF